MMPDMQKILCKVYAFIWQYWLWKVHTFGGPRERLKVIHVKGWRTMLVEDRFHLRQTITPMFGKWDT